MKPLLVPEAVVWSAGDTAPGLWWPVLPNAMQGSWAPFWVWSTAPKNQAGIFSQVACINLAMLQSTSWDMGKKEIFLVF